MRNNIVFPQEPVNQVKLDDYEDDDVDNFAGFSDNHSQFGGYEEINEDEERLLEVFFSKDARPQRTLADIIMEKIKEKDQVPAGLSAGVQPLPKLDDSIIEIYKSTCNLREAVIIGTWKCSSKSLYSTTSFQSGFNETCRNGVWWYNKLLAEKNALPYGVIDAMVTHFMRFCEDSRDMPVIWHQSLLAFMQVTPEILRELNHSRNRGEEANGSFDSRLARSQRQHDLDFWPCFWIRRGDLTYW
ncbi:putative bystin [Helianthus annuus]|nr:putative bystin [Helianthus annuus]